MIPRRIVLVIPPGAHGATPNHEGAGTLGTLEERAGAFRYAPHTVATVAAALRDAGYTVAVIDGPTAQQSAAQAMAPGTRGESWDAASCVAASLGARPSLVGVFVSWATRLTDALFLGILRAEARLIAPVVALGASTIYMREALAGADYLLTGEPEGTFPLLCERLLSGEADLPRVVSPAALGAPGYGADGLLTDLDALPFPAWDLLPIGHYAALSVQGSRGCDAACGWCPYVVAQGRHCRAMSPARVVAELVEDVRRYHPRRVVFRDPVFAADRQRVLDLCRLILAERVLRPGKNLLWECESRPDHFDRELLCLMSLAGCVGIKAGLESVDPALLRREGRCAEPESVPEYLRRTRALVADCARYGIASRLFVLTGLPGQTLEAARQTAAFVREIRPDTLTVKPLKVYPGQHLADISLPTGEQVAEQTRVLTEAQQALAKARPRAPRWRQALRRRWAGLWQPLLGRCGPV